MQFNLFEREDKIDRAYSYINNLIISCGHLHKMYENRIRKYGLDHDKPVSAILSSLRELQAVSECIHMHLSEISSVRPLKTDELKRSFESKFKDEQLKLSSTSQECWTSFFDLKNSYSKLNGAITSLYNKFGNLQSEKLAEFRTSTLIKLSSIGLEMRKTVEYNP